jgi:hypothetical protein
MIDNPGAGAAAVATQLVAFYREPARWRPRYIHGQDPLPEGHVVLKFALDRFSPGWQRDLKQQDREELVAAARAFVRQVCLWERATHYQVLCLGPEAEGEQVKENYRLLMALMHPDRADGRHLWPSNGAQRVNEAYAVLSDRQRRKEYDEGASRPHAPDVPAYEHVVAHVAKRAPAASAKTAGTLGRRAAVIGGTLVGVVALQAWWVGDVPNHLGVLERMQPPGGWMREALPRFMHSRPTIAFDPLELLAPSKLSGRLTSASFDSSPAPATSPATAGPSGSVPLTSARASTVAATVAPAPIVPAPAAPARAATSPTPIRLAQATTGPAAPIASPVQATGGNAAGPTNQDVENVVARLVGCYESGDVDGLMALFDPDELGFWQGFRTRSAYSDFFRSTKQRRLRMDRLQWTTSAQSARAQGDATVVADMADGGKLERKTEIALEVRVRDGQARITRLSMYPDAR